MNDKGFNEEEKEIIETNNVGNSRYIIFKFMTWLNFFFYFYDIF